MRYVAFLRAINVGGHTVKMDHLRALFEQLSLSKVETFIASGNVIFESRAAASALEAKIEKHLARELGYEVATFIRPASALSAAVSAAPFTSAQLSSGATLFIGFLKTALSKEAASTLAALSTDVDTLEAVDRQVYWLREKGAESMISGTRIEKAIRGPVTLRNVTTVRKLTDKYGE